MGVIYAENTNAMFDPEEDDAFELFPELLPAVNLEIKGIDVFVLLWRVFRVLHGIVGAPAKPFRMFLYIGVIRRTLKGDIQRYFNMILAGLAQKALEILQGAKFRMYGLVPSFVRSNSPRGPRVIWIGYGVVVSPFTVCAANRVDGGQIEDVEPHCRDVGKTGLAVLEGSVTA